MGSCRYGSLDESARFGGDVGTFPLIAGTITEGLGDCQALFSIAIAKGIVLIQRQLEAGRLMARNDQALSNPG
jgi:hypothetical protein